MGGPAGRVCFPVGGPTTSAWERACSPALARPQVWSITYHSWLTFCAAALGLPYLDSAQPPPAGHAWARPSSCSMGWAPGCLRYVWASGPSRPELPTAVPASLRQLGLEHTRYPCLDLGAMVSPPGPHSGSQCGGHAAQGPIQVSPGPLAKASIVAQLVFVK